MEGQHRAVNVPQILISGMRLSTRELCLKCIFAATILGLSSTQHTANAQDKVSHAIMAETIATFAGDVMYCEPTSRGIYAFIDDGGLLLYNRHAENFTTVSAFPFQGFQRPGWLSYKTSHYRRFGSLLAFTESQVTTASGLHLLDTASGSVTNYPIPDLTPHVCRAWGVQRANNLCGVVAGGRLRNVNRREATVWHEVNRWFDVRKRRWLSKRTAPSAEDLDRLYGRDTSRLTKKQHGDLLQMSEHYGFSPSNHASLIATAGILECWSYPPARDVPYPSQTHRFPTLVAVSQDEIAVFPYLEAMPQGINLRRTQLRMVCCGNGFLAAAVASAVVIMDMAHGEMTAYCSDEAVNAIAAAEDGLFVATGKRIVLLRWPEMRSTHVATSYRD
jgi:hypothetical protein